MRATRIEVLDEQETVSLTGRARFCGIYLLREANREPLKANETSVIAAGFALVLAGFLVV